MIIIINFKNKNMLEHFRTQKRHHRMWVIIIGLFVLLFSTSAVALTFGMNRLGLLFFFGLFLLVGWLMELGIEHY
ncbi:MAG TPA: hypothetical protein DEB09_04180 [Candidatus Magasanikbacteria bacterium]|nr:hypothetical protein [Candidatus Magasanikbacteria bacterium]